MTVDVVTEIEIARARADVAAYSADPDNATTWYRNIEAVAWETTPPLVIGSRMRFRARFLGRTLEYTYEVLEHEPSERLVMSMANGPFPMETTYTWSDGAAGGTHMALRNRGEPEGALRMLSSVVAAGVRRANRADLARLKAILERREP